MKATAINKNMKDPPTLHKGLYKKIPLLLAKASWIEKQKII